MLAAAAEAAGREHHDGTGASGPRRCCDHHATAAAAAEAYTRTHEPASPGCHASEGASHETRLVFSISARACRGLASLWCANGAVLAPPAVSWRYSWNVAEWLSPATAALATLDPAPPVPPPRV